MSASAANSSQPSAAADSPQRLKRIDVATMGFDRPVLLRNLGLEPEFPLAGDFAFVKSPSVQGVRPLKIHRDNVPFIDAGSALECCSGAKIKRWGHVTVAVPCYSVDVIPDSQFCPHCTEMWSLSDKDGFFVSDTNMLAVMQEYAAGETKNILQWESYKAVKDKYHDMITAIKDTLAGSSSELETQWPHASFDDVAAELLFDTPILTNGTKGPGSKRCLLQQQAIAAYLEFVVPLWLRLRAFHGADAMQSRVEELFEVAEGVADASMWKMQQAFAKYPIFAGPIMAADVVASGLVHAAKSFEVMFADEGKSAGESRIEWGTRVYIMQRWANSVHEREMPGKSALRLAGSSPAVRKGRGFYAVARGFTVGVFTDVNLARKSTDGFKGSDWFRCRTRAEAEQYVRDHKELDMTTPSSTTPSPQSRVRASGTKRRLDWSSSRAGAQARAWFVAKGTSRPGIFRHQAVAESYRIKGVGSIVPAFSLQRAHAMFGTGATVYHEETVRAPSPTQASVDGDTDNGASGGDSTEWYAVYSGSSIGVYDSLTEVARSVADGKGEFRQCASEQEAWDLIATMQAAEAHYAGREAPVDTFVVLVGKRVGMMSKQDCLKSVMGVAGAQFAGPFTAARASSFWDDNKARVSLITPAPHERCSPPKIAEKTKAVAAPAAAAVTFASPPVATASVSASCVSWPSDAEIASAIHDGRKRVYSCLLPKGGGRLELVFEKLVRGLRDPDVFVTHTGVDVLANLEEAERKLRRRMQSMDMAPSLASRIAAAKASAKHAVASPAVAAATSSAVAIDVARDTGKHARSLVGRRGLVRSREAAQIMRVFVLEPESIRIMDESENVHVAKILRVELPGSKLYGTAAPKSIRDYFSSTDTKSGNHTWGLLSLSKFLVLCRRAREACEREAKPSAQANIKALFKIAEIATDEYEMMEMSGTLGPNEIRFKVRMYLHIQFMSDTLTLPVGPGAMTNFARATEKFGPRVPGWPIDLTGDSPGKGVGASMPSACPTVSSSSKSTPKFGCWLCPSPDHYVSKATHPVMPTSLSKQVKDTIIKRIQDYPCTQSEKEAGLKSLKAYWSRHKL